jgi:sulfide dehydrogenase cytochrome subunit
LGAADKEAPETILRKLALYAFAGACVAMLAAVPARAQNADPQLLIVSCSGCHGTGGHSAGAIPSIYGRNAASIAETLREFRDDKRPATIMNRLAKGYSDTEIDTLAREIAAKWAN